MNFTVQAREKTGKGFNRKLRDKGLNSGIVYGKEEPMMISMNSERVYRFIKSMKGAVKAFELIVESEGGSASKNVIVQDYQVSNVGDKLLHADFLEVNDNTVLSVDVPVVVVNEEICPAVKTGGVLQTIRRMIPVKCAVKDIPESIVLDVKDLEFDETIHVLDLEYPKGVSPVVTGRNFTVLTVAGRTEEEIDEVEEELEGVELEEGEEETKDGKPVEGSEETAE